MLSTSIVALLLAIPAITAIPIQKRIAQSIADATRDWEQACLSAGGGQACNPVSITAFSALLAAPDACAQQDAADDMIDLAHNLGNDPEMIRLAQLFRQQPRNAPDSLSVLYCQRAARNSEITNLFQCQFAGVNSDVFTGNVPVGSAGTIPFGRKAPLSPAGSCPASNQPVPDGQQLNKLTSDPKASSTGGKVTTKPTAATTKAASTTVAATSKATKTKTKSTKTKTKTATQSAATAGGSFTVQNGLDAKALNERFSTLSTTSSCQDGEQACLKGAFAQCVAGKFVVTQCAGGTQCFALPLVNSRGTSLACTTAADAQARIDTALGSGSAAPCATSATSKPVASSPVASSSATAAPAGGAKSFTLQNGLKAQSLNKQFAALTASSPCNAGDVACLKGGFAQCVGNRFVVTGCGSGLTCAALPLVNSAGTSITCTTTADAIARIAATGASPSLTGE
ncbi:hypothetical protein BKA62DRAFT_685412 [Auriculariales sp. MPI-PUGE-AT-0066]|nr:hypothetical protein BKA62DRAFT_685412 [Auriculariales sp. MPI-PUGE-AT-0066]